MTLRVALVGAVGTTEVALRALADCGHSPVLLFTLPLEKQGRHSDFVDLGPLAAELGVPLVRVDDVNAPEAVARLRGAAPDLLLVIGWSRLCGAEFREVARLGTLGYHPTLLPKMRGRAALAWTILLGLDRTGGTLFWMDEGVDSGPIAAQRAFDIPPGTALPDLLDLQLEALAGMIPSLFAQLESGARPSEPQDHGAATYLAHRRPADGEIDWNEDSESIERLVRAVTRPYPGAFSRLGDREVVLWSARVVHYPQWHALIGQVFAYEDGAPVVRCGGGTDLCLTDYQFRPAHDGDVVPSAIRGQPRFRTSK
ncbi:MAG TPA: methionyl-tRNA formyltransferase [Allosphingosinicella sp.]|nr:methionyl-tRNA formyltransferase [Allosphingosinicella sp.]